MIKVTADSTCDLSREILDELSITLTPLTVIIGEKPYHDGVDITPADLFKYVSIVIQKTPFYYTSYSSL